MNLTWRFERMQNPQLEKPALLIIDMLEDCCAAFTEEIHRQTLNSYRRNPLYPLLRVSTSDELYDELGLTIAE